MDNIRIKYKRGGKEFRNSSFSLDEAQTSIFGSVLNEAGVTNGLANNFEIYVRDHDNQNEISTNGKKKMTFEGVLRTGAEDGEIINKCFIIDITAEHKGAKN